MNHNGRKIHTLPGRMPGAGPASPATAFMAQQLNRMFGEINAQVGRLAPDGQVLVAYMVQGFRPALDAQGGLSVDLKWLKKDPKCLYGLKDASPCLKPATHAAPGGIYLCEDHAGLSAELMLAGHDGPLEKIADIVAAANQGKDGAS